jgi:hypothetical protein
MKPHAAWPWSESLGAVRADPGQLLRVRRILFGMVRDHCHEVGLEEGTELRYGDRTPEGVVLELSGRGRRIRSTRAVLVFFFAVIGVTPVVLLLVIASWGRATNYIVERIAPAIAALVFRTAGIRFHI